MVKQIDKNEARLRRHRRVRNKISGTAARPRLDVFRSAKHIYAQIIDDEQGVTLVSASTMDKDFNGNGGNVEAAAEIGKKIAAKALEKGITEVVFDRGGYVYHGRVKAVRICLQGADGFHLGDGGHHFCDGIVRVSGGLSQAQAFLSGIAGNLRRA